MKHLTWADIEEHKDAVAPAQWRRMEAYFRYGVPISQVAHRDGMLIDHSPREFRSAQQSLGRGCIRLLDSLLGRPVVKVSPDVLAQPVHSLGEPCGKEPDSNTGTAQELPPTAPPASPRPRRKSGDRGWYLARPKHETLPVNDDPAPPAATENAAEPVSTSTAAATAAEPPLTGSGPAVSDGALALALREALRKRSESVQSG